ncbi:MAG: tetratricopeptide repeat protein [Rhodospirillales bacterium]
MEMIHASADPMALVRRVGALIDAGRCGAAGPLLAAARQLIAPSPELSLLAARLAEGQGEHGLARAEFDAAVEAAPGHGDLRKQRASFCHRIGDFECAARDAAEAVILDSTDSDAKALLGSALLNLGRPREARACLSEACTAEPSNPTFREALAIATEADGDPDAAFAILRAGLTPDGGALNLRNAAILFCIRHKSFRQAVGLAEDGRIAGTVDACLFGLKGHAQSSLGLHAEAADSYAEALKLGPDDPYVRHLVASSGMLPSAKRAPPDYLRAVFDGYADRFDDHLIGLGYRIPGEIRRIALEYLDFAGACGPVLDLGCGTGLIGVAIGDLQVGPLTGVDISARMLAEAKSKDLYAALDEADVLDWLADNPDTWQLILAGDMLCYFGALDMLLRAIQPRLGAAGWFVFSVEERLDDADGQGWALQRQGRYAHSRAYMEEVLRTSDFAIRQMESQIIRMEAGAPVRGLLIVVEPARPVH